MDLKEIKDTILSFGKKKEVFNANLAWYESRYGESTYTDIKTRIENKQQDIKELIKSKFAPLNNVAKTISYASYHCSVDLDKDLIPYAKDIFTPFEEKGFKIINLSDKCKEIEEDGVYLISWVKGYEYKEVENS